MRPGRERDGDLVAGVARRLLDRRAAAQHDDVGERDLRPPACETLNACWICSRTGSTRASCSGSLTAQLRCGSRRIRAPLAPPRKSVLRKLAADAHAVETSCGMVSPESRIVRLEGGDVGVADQLVPSTGGTGSCHSCGSGTHGPR